jgi:hypothetical protein
MSTSPSTPVILHAIAGKVEPEVENVIRLMSNGLKDAHDAIVALKAQHDALAAQVGAAPAPSTTTVTQTVTAGQVNPQTAAYTVQQSDHLGVVPLQGSSAITVTLNSAVATPFTTRISNLSSATATLVPSTGTLNGSASLAAGASVNVNFDGLNWWAG